MSAPICEICNKGPANGLSVFRINAKGVPGIWRCRQHISSEQADRVPTEVISIANMIDSPAISAAQTQGGKGT